LIELADRLFGHGAIGVIHEREAARPARFPVYREDDGSRDTDGGQVLPQLCFRRRVGQVADEQSN
jgi:hypothetical protein